MRKRYFETLSLLLTAAALLAAASCSDFVEPGMDNVLTREEVIANPVLAEGILLKAYDGFPSTLNYTAVATGDAYTNNISNGYMLAASGSWSALSNPFSEWSAYTQIAYINFFLENIVDEVEWFYSSPWKNEEFRKRVKGEAYALRAYHHSRILQAHSGKASDGTLLGIPYMDHLVSASDDDTSTPRLAFEECVRKIEADVDSALAMLPDFYADAPASLPNKSEYDAIYGSRCTNRISGIAAKMVRARVRLLAASPAFNLDGDVTLWEEAADAAAEVIDAFGGTANLKSGRTQYYLDQTSNDILWRLDITNSHNIENAQFPSSLNGSGRVSPSQNLVDAFPMKNGYPIADPASGFDPADPFKDRDPRLGQYVVYNGAILKGAKINTVDHAANGIGKTEFSTVTGYYLKKFTNESVSLATGNIINAIHFVTLMRYTEAFLIYAEAANEAWGPDGTGTHAYSARDVMAALRQTAGIDVPDAYLAGIGTQADMRTFIRNERRLEMSFEQVRFWDVRRWLDYDAMKETVLGTFDGGLTSTVVKTHTFENYMVYGPVPNADVVKGLVQNDGWKNN